VSTGAATAETLIAGVLAGETRAIAKAISLAETGFDASEAAMAALHPHTGKAHIVGITGVPGSGKSTLVRALTQEFRKAGQRVGIVAVDPSSPYSGGAILGDRVRMADLANDPGVFIRSLATRGALGGLARAAMDAVDVLDAAGFDVVLVETVGVGQDEVDIARAAHTVVVVSAPGLGDGVQAIKAGVLEIADIHAVSKADRPGAGRTASELRAMLELSPAGRAHDGWTVPVLETSAETGTGIDHLAATVGAHLRHLKDSGAFARRRQTILEARVLKTAEDLARTRIERSGVLPDVLARVAAGDLDPRAAAQVLLRGLSDDPG
jgi:LAO/AO transport system kinase